MSWNLTLLDASFRGVPFDVVSTDDAFGHALQLVEYPFRDGAQIDDLGLTARRIRVQALFNGPDYETALDAFLKALKQPGEGNLIHPVFGSVEACVSTFDVQHGADTPDHCLVAVEFVEAGLPVALFANTPAQSKAVAIQNTVDSASATAAATFSGQVAALAKRASNNREYTILGDTLDSMLGAVQLLSPRTALARLPGISQPLSWAADVSAIASSLRDTTRVAYGLDNFDPTTLASDFFGLTGLFSNWPQPQTPKGTYADGVKSMVTAQGNLAPTLELSRTLADVLAQESVTPTLSPADIGRMADTVRAMIQTRIDECELAYDLVQGRPLVEALRGCAHAVLDAAKAVIEARPPIIQRQVANDINLHRLAHLWYGDWTRSYELLRLNPQVKNPNFISRGDTLNAYAA